jgi:hypothetical protein
LLKPLDYYQGAPLGFLLLQKLITETLGTGELALRAVPLFAGIASMFLFLRVAHRLLPGGAVPLALLFFALSGPLIYYSASVKPYSSDVAVALLLLWLATELRDSQLRSKSIVLFALVGGTAIWFSHPASLVAAGTGAALLVWALRRRDRQHCARLTIVLALWGLSFAGCYASSLRTLTHNPTLLDFWRQSFPPSPLWSWCAMRWLSDRVFSSFREVVGIMPPLGAGLSLAGVWAMGRRSREILALLIAPILVALLAAALHKYPFGGRLLLFLAPTVALLMAEGGTWFAQKAARLSPWASTVVVVLIVAQPAASALYDLVAAQPVEDIRPVVRYIRDHRRPGDVLYLYHFAQYQFWYYAEREKLAYSPVRIGKECKMDLACYRADLDSLRGNPRIWVLFSHIWIGDGIDEEQFFLAHLDRIGTRLDVFRARQARVYLYDLSETSRQNRIPLGLPSLVARHKPPQY